MRAMEGNGLWRWAGVPAPRACLSPALTPVLFSSPLLVLVILGTVLSSAAVSLCAFGSLWELSLLCSAWCFYSRAAQIGSDAPHCQYGSGLCWGLLSAFSWQLRAISFGRVQKRGSELGTPACAPRVGLGSVWSPCHSTNALLLQI